MGKREVADSGKAASSAGPACCLGWYLRLGSGHKSVSHPDFCSRNKVTWSLSVQALTQAVSVKFCNVRASLEAEAFMLSCRLLRRHFQSF